MGFSFPGGVEANIRQRVSLPGVVSFGLRSGTKFNRLLPFEEWEKVAEGRMRALSVFENPLPPFGHPLPCEGARARAKQQ